jgi:hypothetical protein
MSLTTTAALLLCITRTLLHCRLTAGGRQAYADLISFFNASGMVIDFNELHLKGVIGSGAFATVFRAVYRYYCL